MTQQHRHGLLEQDVLAGPCDREVEAVIVGDIAQVTFIVPIELPESGLNGLDVRPCPASGGQPCRFAFQRGPKLEAEDQGGNAGDWGKLDRSVLLPTDDKGPKPWRVVTSPSACKRERASRITGRDTPKS